MIAGCDPYSGNSEPGFFWNRKCFVVPPNGRFGTASRGFLGGRTSWNTNFNVFKKFNLTKIEVGPYLKLELYVQNFFNHANAAGPSSTTIDSANFGRFDADGSRSMYIRVRIGF
ncbi:MAG: hypothetical protein EXQ58_03865 [Acidobacteria bacterium]|nr:hypothetical protein [Acidobacteriota bacterium]